VCEQPPDGERRQAAFGLLCVGVSHGETAHGRRQDMAELREPDPGREREFSERKNLDSFDVPAPSSAGADWPSTLLGVPAESVADPSPASPPPAESGD
jgi:hypothetical protein